MKIDVVGFVKRHVVLTMVVVVIIALVGWWKYEFPSATWRYKMTVTVETPEGIKTGSAVREVSISYGPTIGDIPSTNVTVKGEAVVVDLDKRGVMFVLLGNDYAYDLVFRAFSIGVGGLTKEGIEYYSHLKNGKASLLEKNYLPSSVTFINLNDPMSVKPANIRELSIAFGQGVKLKDVIVEMTDEPVTWKIDDYLPWLKDHIGNLYGERYASSSGLGGILDRGAFVGGDKND